MAARHTDHVNDILCNGVPGCGKVVDPSGMKNGQVDLAPKMSHLPEKRGQRGGHTGHIAGETRERIDLPGYKIEEVENAVVLKLFRNLNVVADR